MSLKKLLLLTTLPIIIYPRLIIETITRSYRTTYIPQYLTQLSLSSEYINFILSTYQYIALLFLLIGFLTVHAVPSTHLQYLFSYTLPNRSVPDMTSGPEVRKIFKIRTVRKQDVFLPGCRTFKTFKDGFFCLFTLTWQIIVH